LSGPAKDSGMCAVATLNTDVPHHISATPDGAKINISITSTGGKSDRPFSLIAYWI